MTIVSKTAHCPEDGGRMAELDGANCADGQCGEIK
jgi:hypothetical protein